MKNMNVGHSLKIEGPSPRSALMGLPRDPLHGIWHQHPAFWKWLKHAACASNGLREIPMTANYMISAKPLNNLHLGFASAFCFVFVVLYPPYGFSFHNQWSSTELYLPLARANRGRALLAVVSKALGHRCSTLTMALVNMTSHSDAGCSPHTSFQAFECEQCQLRSCDVDPLVPDLRQQGGEPWGYTFNNSNSSW